MKEIKSTYDLAIDAWYNVCKKSTPVYDKDGQMYSGLCYQQPARSSCKIGRKYVYLRNCNGEFPYAIKNSLSFLVLSSGDGDCFTRIIDVETTPGTRFNYQGAGKPIVEDANGDSCIWEVSFEVVSVPAEAKSYLMRWNPSISSFTEKDFEECVENMVHGMFRMNWSICEWEEARRGDLFFMMRTGDDKAGIVFSGQFISDPYPSDDWAEGHSGVLLPEDIVTKLDELCERD